MRLNTANRSFLALVGLAAIPYAIFGTAACALVGSLVLQVHDRGWAALTAEGQDLRPTLGLVTLLAAGTLVGTVTLVSQIRATLRLRRRVRAIRLPTPPALRATASRWGLAGRVDLVDSSEPFSFAYGCAFPRVAVSSGLADASSPDELDAVLAHERYHVRAHDPAKVLLAHALPRALFFLPALRQLRRRYVAGRELAADRRAMRSCGQAPLAGALTKVLRGPPWPELRTAAAIGGGELLEARVVQLETGREPPIPGVSPLAALGTAIGLGLLAVLVAVAFLGLEDPFAFLRTHRQHAAFSHRHGPWDLVGFGISAAAWTIGGWWLWRRLHRRRA